MEISNYKDLTVWKKSLNLAEDVYVLTKNFPNEEKFGLTSQMRRSSVSIPSNIAEGRTRGSRADFRRFCYMAFGSANELETQILIANALATYPTQDKWMNYLPKY